MPLKQSFRERLEKSVCLKTSVKMSETSDTLQKVNAIET